MAEAAALEAIKEEMQKKEEERAKRQQNGYLYSVIIVKQKKKIKYLSFQGVPYQATFSEVKATV